MFDYIDLSTKHTSKAHIHCLAKKLCLTVEFDSRLAFGIIFVFDIELRLVEQMRLIAVFDDKVVFCDVIAFDSGS